MCCVRIPLGTRLQAWCHIESPNPGPDAAPLLGSASGSLSSLALHVRVNFLPRDACQRRELCSCVPYDACLLFVCLFACLLARSFVCSFLVDFLSPRPCPSRPMPSLPPPLLLLIGRCQIMILALFNSHPRRIRHPFHALVLFFEEYADFSWGSNSITVNGPRHMFLATSHSRPHAVRCSSSLRRGVVICVCVCVCVLVTNGVRSAPRPRGLEYSCVCVPPPPDSFPSASFHHRVTLAEVSCPRSAVCPREPPDVSV